MENLPAASMVAKPTADSITGVNPIDAEPMAEMTPIKGAPVELADAPWPTHGRVRARQCSAIGRRMMRVVGTSVGNPKRKV
jgi:hypothetical protein